MTGRKNSFWGLPKSGIDEDEIKNCIRFGKAINQALENDEEKHLEPMCKGLGAVDVDVKLIKSEQIATKSFTIWGKLISKVGKPGNIFRKPIVMLYVLFLVAIILTVVPINMIIQTINRKINKDKVQALKEYYEKPSGNDMTRIKDFK